MRDLLKVYQNDKLTKCDLRNFIAPRQNVSYSLVQHGGFRAQQLLLSTEMQDRTIMFMLSIHYLLPFDFDQFSCRVSGFGNFCLRLCCSLFFSVVCSASLRQDVSVRLFNDRSIVSTPFPFISNMQFSSFNFHHYRFYLPSLLSKLVINVCFVVISPKRPALVLGP